MAAVNVTCGSGYRRMRTQLGVLRAPLEYQAAHNAGICLVLGKQASEGALSIQ